MSFKLLKEAERYQAQIDSRRDEGAKFKLKFDFYYLCLMVGLDLRELGNSDQEEELKKNSAFIEYYPEVYRDKADLILTLLIDAELDRKAITRSNQKEVENVIFNLVDFMAVTRLNVRGHDMLNIYAAGGFNAIKDRIPAPQELELFLIEYKKLFEEIA